MAVSCPGHSAGRAKCHWHDLLEVQLFISSSQCHGGAQMAIEWAGPSPKGAVEPQDEKKKEMPAGPARCFQDPRSRLAAGGPFREPEACGPDAGLEPQAGAPAG